MYEGISKIHVFMSVGNRMASAAAVEEADVGVGSVCTYVCI